MTWTIPHDLVKRRGQEIRKGNSQQETAISRICASTLLGCWPSTQTLVEVPWWITIKSTTATEGIPASLETVKRSSCRLKRLAERNLELNCHSMLHKVSRNWVEMQQSPLGDILVMEIFVSLSLWVGNEMVVEEEGLMMGAPAVSLITWTGSFTFRRSGGKDRQKWANLLIRKFALVKLVWKMA